MKISLIATTYNRPDFLRKVLAGYLAQKRLPDEAVIADDGSGPETKDVVDDFRKKAPFPIIHARQEKVGIRLSRLRNMATRASSGEYVIYTDGDCIPGPWFIKDHERLAEPGWFVQGKRFMVQQKANEVITGAERWPRLLMLWLSGGIKKLHHIPHIPGLAIRKKSIKGIISCNLAVWRKDIYNINGWNEKFVGFWRQDSEFALRLLLSGIRRKDALFSAVSFHLAHEKPLVQQDLARNTQLLEDAKHGPFYVPDGIANQSDGNSDKIWK